MSRDALPEDVRSFLTTNVSSLMALELLLLMQADPAREWSASELARELRAETRWAEDVTQDLAKRGLLAATEADASKFRYSPHRPGLDAAATKLAAIYPQRKFSVIQAMYPGPSEPIQSFADAFKLRKDPSDG